MHLIKKSPRNAHIRATSTLDDRGTGTDAPFDNYINVVAQRCGEAKKRGDADRYTLVMSFTVDKHRLPPPDRQESIKKRRRAFEDSDAPDRIKIFQISEHWPLDTSQSEQRIIWDLQDDQAHSGLPYPGRCSAGTGFYSTPPSPYLHSPRLRIPQASAMRATT